MSRETVQLAEYAAALRYEDIPADVVDAAKNTIADGIAACVYGYRFPWRPGDHPVRPAIRCRG